MHSKTIEYMRRRTEWNEVVENINKCNEFDNVVVDLNKFKCIKIL